MARISSQRIRVRLGASMVKALHVLPSKRLLKVESRGVGFR